MPVEMGSRSDEDCDNLNDSQVDEYKVLVYKFFQFRTYKLRCSNGGFGCPFCDTKEEHRHQYSHLLLHAIRVAEGSESGKQRANHFAMARYLAVDLAHEFKAEDARLLERDMDANAKALHLETELNEKEDYISHLISKERQSNDELQAARKELIKGLNDFLRGNDDDNIGIKNVGEIDSKVFICEMEKRFSTNEYAAIKGVEMCSAWQENLKNPQWHPYRIMVDETGKAQRLVNEDDATLQDLKKELGQEVHDAVVVAMNELQEYNPSGCYVVPELWNFNENRKAKLDEVISYILEAFKDVFKTRDTPEIYNYKEEMYMILKNNYVSSPYGGLRCPFCSVEGDKEYDYLLRHAIMVAEDSLKSAEQRGNHFALAKYLVVDLQDETHAAIPKNTKSSRTYESFEEDDEIVEGLPLSHFLSRACVVAPCVNGGGLQGGPRREVTDDCQRTSVLRASTRPPAKRTSRTLGDPGSSSRPPTKRTRKTSKDPEGSGGNTSRKSKGQT